MSHDETLSRELRELRERRKAEIVWLAYESCILMFTVWSLLRI